MQGKSPTRKTYIHTVTPPNMTPLPLLVLLSFALFPVIADQPRAALFLATVMPAFAAFLNTIGILFSASSASALQSFALAALLVTVTALIFFSAMDWIPSRSTTPLITVEVQVLAALPVFLAFFASFLTITFSAASASLALLALFALQALATIPGFSTTVTVLPTIILAAVILDALIIGAAGVVARWTAVLASWPTITHLQTSKQIGFRVLSGRMIRHVMEQV